MTSLFQQAVKLNHEGICSLLQGDQTSSIQSMSEAIKFMKLALLSETNTNACRPMSVSPLCSSGCSSVEIPPSSKASDTIVFNQAIMIPTNETRIRNNSEMNICTSAVIFNLALAYHSLGDVKSMAKAETLYALVIKLFDSNPALCARTALIVKLAAINNLSQIRYSNGDYSSAREGASQVSGFIRQMEGAMLDEPDVQRLLMQVLLLKPPTAAPAA
jgi:hypothetical protein